MMLMWKKESNDHDAIYADLFVGSDLTFCAQNYKAIQTQIGLTREKKRDAISLAYRKNGNTLFGEGRWVAAMEKYNDSLRYAETGSPNISLALGNRSACFFHLKMFDECLIDIESAKQIGYPENLMSKLEQRKLDCLKNIEESVRGPFDDIGRKLSFEADEKFPCMANVLQMNSDNDGHASIVAKDDIGVGQTITIERPFISYLYMHYGHKCNICLKERSNLRPCKICTIAMFCSDQCERHHLHELECDLKFCDRNQFNGQILEGIRLIFSIIKHFANANELMDFVEQVVNNDRKELPVSLVDFQSQYRAFLKCSFSSEFMNSDNFLVMTYCTYTFVLTVLKVSEWFPLPKHRRFLAHLIGHHVRILEKHPIKVRYLDNKTDALCYMGLMNQFFGHSCAANVLNCEYNGCSTFVTIRPIKKGDQLQISYVEPTAFKAVRQFELRQRYNINCDCMRCNGLSSATPAERNQISSDSDFKEIVSFKIVNLHDTSADKAQKMIEKCITVLERYNNILWCDEIQQMVDMFVRVIRLRFSSSLSYNLEEILVNSFKNSLQ